MDRKKISRKFPALLMLAVLLLCLPICTVKAETPAEADAGVKEVIGIEITSAPSRTLYFEGDGFDPAGMVITASYSDGTKVEITDYTVEPAGPLSSETTKMTMAYEGKTAEQAITVTNSNGWISFDGIWYYFENGALSKNKWLQDSRGWCYVGDDGALVQQGWATDDKGWRYIQNGYWVKEAMWVLDIKGWCYIGEDGYWVNRPMWIRDSLGWCYIGSSGYMMQNGWVKDEKHGWAYIENGYWVDHNEWVQDSAGWCYIGDDGYWHEKPGWLNDTIGWCFIGGSGYRIQQGWIQDTRGWAFVENGYWVDHYRWVRDTGGWYGIDDSGYWSGQPALAVIPGDDIKVSCIDVGQSESILIQQGSNAMLIDAGYKEKSWQVINFIREQGVTKLGYIIATHPHGDHIGGLAAVIDSFDIGKVYMPRVSAESEEIDALDTAMDNKRIKKTIPYLGETFKLGEATCTFLGPVESTYQPSDGEPDGLNTFSIVLKITYKDNSFLFTGDAHTGNEQSMVKAGFDLSADVLKVGHHGCDTSTSTEFLNAVNPSYAIISAGKDNIWGIPTKGVLTKLKDKNIETFRTDINGTIICTGNGTRICFSCDPPDPSIGWVSRNNQWYYYRSDGSAVTGWITFNGKEYYFYSDGILATNTVTPDGYTVGEDGTWVGTGRSLSAG
ncbi:MAG: MBL fold metallo-hydrolase [Clostridiaceae bacterium]